MTMQMPAEPRKTPPSWLVPTGIGVVIALLAVIIVIMVTRDDDDSDSSSTTTTAQIETTVPTTAPETSVAETSPPDTVPATTVAATEPATTVPDNITEGQAVLVTDGETLKFSVAATCSDFWAGLQTTSHVLVENDSKRVWVVDVFAGEEGGDRGIQAVDMAYTIAANIYGQDAAVSPTYAGSIDEGQAGLVRSTLTLTSGDGPASIELAFGEPSTVGDCAVGWLSPQSPYPAGTQVQWLSPDESTGQRFNVLANCGDELLLTGGGLLLTTYPQDGGTMMAGLVNTHNLTGDDVWWTNLVSPTPDETAFDQGGGGDITAAINAYPDGDRSAAPGYLSWTERPPRSSVGEAGLLADVCTAGP